MEEQELRNFLRSEGEQLTEVPKPTIDITERVLEDICDSIESEGLDHLIANLGTITNAFKTENDFTCSPDVQGEAVKVIHTALVRLHMEITSNQGNVKGSLANVDKQMRHKYRKYMAVIFFLINKSFEEIERAVAAESHNISIQLAAKETGRRKKKQTDRADDSKLQFWSFWRPKIIEQLWKIVAPPLDEVWENNPNPDGYNFLRCITLALCTAIKNKAKHIRNMDQELQDIFDILGILVSKHNEEGGITPRLIPLLKGSEETASIIACGIDRIVQLCPDKAQNIVLQVITEAYTVYTARFDRESGQERGFHTFLTQLCQLQPKGALQSQPMIVQFLDAESYVVRNAVLVIAHELMNWIWAEMQAEENSQRTEEERDERRKDGWLKTRETLLNEILLKYLKDVNSLVRSKGVNLLADLVRRQAIVPKEAVEIMKHVKLRLLDKTVTTRKAATSLVVELVKVYPHIVRPTAEYERKRDEKIEEICTTIRNDESNPAVALFFIIKEFFLHIDLYGFMASSVIKEKVTTPEAALALLEQLLKEGKYWKACETMHLCIRKWSDQVEQLLCSLKRQDDDTPDHLYIRFFKATCPEIFPQTMDSLELGELNYIAPKRVEDARDFLAYIQNCLRMQFELEKCQPSLRKLLELGTTTDKKEAVMFFAAICEAGYKPPHAITVSIISALSQLNAEEFSDFVQPFKYIFIGRDNLGAAGVVRKLIELVQSLSENMVESLSGMIGELFKSDVLTSESVKVLWDAFCLSVGGWTIDESRSAAYIIGIIGQIERKVVTTNLNQLIEIGLGQRGLEDYELAKITLQTILFGCRVEKESNDAEAVLGKGRGAKVVKSIARSKSTEETRFPPSHELFSKIIELIETGLRVEGSSQMNQNYPRVVELAMQIIYRMSTQPSEIVGRFLPNIHGFLFAAFTQTTDTQTQTQTQQQSQPDATQDPFKMSEKLLFRYMSFGKALFGAHILYYEQIVTKEIKLRKQVLEKCKKKNRVARQRTSRASLANGSTSLSGSTLNQSGQDATEMDVMIGTIGFDAEGDNIKAYVAKLLDSGFFRQFRVHVLYLCGNFKDIKTLNLKIAVVQALTKLMLVCENSVIKSIDHLVQLWNGDEPFAVKLEILRASIRLTVKFPNQMEKINDCLSTGLADKDARVRKACMDYIQYLALSDLLKVREQLSDTAACLCDENFELREMARDFINQIAEKDNVLQNSIPDIISRLSGREDITQENFQIIMKTLLAKIKKEKQLGGLIERIVGRFKGPVSVRVCQDTAFCLTQIQQNEKTLKILKDNLSNYADKLADPFVWESFCEIVAAIKKLNKPELKIRLDEWEKDLEENHGKCVATDDAEKAAKKKHDKPQRKRMVHQSSSEDEGEDENKEEENDGGREEQVANDDGEGEEEEQMEQSDPERSQRQRENAAKKKHEKERAQRRERSRRQQSSSGDEDEEDNGDDGGKQSDSSEEEDKPVQTKRNKDKASKKMQEKSRPRRKTRQASSEGEDEEEQVKSSGRKAVQVKREKEDSDEMMEESD